MESEFEAVLTVEEWYDGPRTGAANYRGRPHFYRSLYLDTPEWDPDEDRFELTPVSPEALAWSLEDYRLWERWNEARAAGQLPDDGDDDPDDLRVLPGDRDRHCELRALVEGYLARERPRAFVVRGEFELGARRVRWRAVP